MKFLSNVIRAVLGIGLGIVGFGLIPVYGAPFIGCEGSRWLSLESGCSVWLELSQGAFFVLPIAVLAPSRWLLPIFAVVVLFFFSFLGGIEGVQTGRYLSIESVADMFYLFLGSYQNFVGGFLVMLVWLISFQKLNAKPDKVPNHNDGSFRGGMAK